MARSRHLAIDLFCGLFGWADGLTAEGFEVVGFDLEDMRGQFGFAKMPNTQLVIQDVLTLHGSQFRDATLIVASPPCQAYSYRAMPWTRAKALPPPDNTLFEACFRIQREACEAAGRHIPMVVENVRGAQPWVGRARWNYGSFYLWGDVPALMPSAGQQVQKFNPDGTAHPPGSWFKIADSQTRGIKQRGSGADWWDKALDERRKSATAIKHGGDWFRDPMCPSRQGGQVRLKGDLVEGRKGINGRSSIRNRDADPRPSHGNSTSRRFASAMIAKIPLPLSRYIASVFRGM